MNDSTPPLSTPTGPQGLGHESPDRTAPAMTTPARRRLPSSR